MMTCTANQILLLCPCCGDDNAGIQINLDHLDNDEAQFTCRECGEDFGVKRINAFIRKWTKVLTWLNNIPDVETE